MKPLQATSINAHHRTTFETHDRSIAIYRSSVLLAPVVPSLLRLPSPSAFARPGQPAGLGRARPDDALDGLFDAARVAGAAREGIVMIRILN